MSSAELLDDIFSSIPVSDLVQTFLETLPHIVSKVSDNRRKLAILKIYNRIIWRLPETDFEQKAALQRTVTESLCITDFSLSAKTEAQTIDLDTEPESETLTTDEDEKQLYKQYKQFWTIASCFDNIQRIQTVKLEREVVMDDKGGEEGEVLGLSPLSRILDSLKPFISLMQEKSKGEAPSSTFNPSTILPFFHLFENQLEDSSF